MQNKISVSRLSGRGAIALLLVFYISSSNTMGTAAHMGGDTWITQLLGFVMAIPLLLIFARLIKLMPGKDLFGMLDFSFGRVLALVIGVLYLYYFIILAATIQRHHAEFVGLVSLRETPQIVILLALFGIGVYLAKSGIQVLGKWSSVIALAVVFIMLLLTLLALPNMQAANLLPIGNHSARDFAQNGVRTAILPFGEAIVLLALIGHLDRKANPYRLFLVGAGIAAVFFALSFLRDAAVLGEQSMADLYFPSFKSASVIQIGSIGSRVEFLAAISFLLTGITKIAVCMIAAARAARRVFSLSDENPIIISVALLTTAFAAILFPNVVELFAFSHTYVYFAPIFQLGIPLLVWLIAEIKTRGKPILDAEH